MLTKDIAQALAGRLQGDGMLAMEGLCLPNRAERRSDLVLAMVGSAAAPLRGRRALAALVSGLTPPSDGSLMADHHIGHNVAIGESCIVAGMVGISGSVNIGDRIRLGDGVGDHVRIGDQAIVAAGSGAGSNVEPGAFVSGYPASPHRHTVEHLQYLGRQKRLHGKVDEMDLRLAALEQSVRN